MPKRKEKAEEKRRKTRLMQSAHFSQLVIWNAAPEDNQRTNGRTTNERGRQRGT
jgi:hypothetical protein